MGLGDGDGSGDGEEAGGGEEKEDVGGKTDGERERKGQVAWSEASPVPAYTHRAPCSLLLPSTTDAISPSLHTLPIVS